MRYCKKNNQKKFTQALISLLFTGFIFLLPAAVFASSELHVKSAELVANGDTYALNAEFDVHFSNTVEEALNKGIPLTFLIEFQLTMPRQYWFDDEIVTTTTHVTLSYHALSRQYLVNYKDNHQRAFASLHDAKVELSQLRGWHVLDKSLLKKGEAYQAALRIRLDQSKLPKPLQVDVIGGAEDWNIISQRYRWTPALL